MTFTQNDLQQGSHIATIKSTQLVDKKDQIDTIHSSKGSTLQQSNQYTFSPPQLNKINQIDDAIHSKIMATIQSIPFTTTTCQNQSDC